MSSKEISIPDNEFKALSPESAQSARNVIAENLDGEVSASLFQRIQFPRGGSQFYTVPDIDGDSPVKSIDAIILHHATNRAYWESEFGGGENPAPDCYSKDGLTGVGTPGGKCNVCPFNEYGSGKGGGKACKERKPLAVLRPLEVLPQIISLPVMSIKQYSIYMTRLASRGITKSDVITSIGIRPAKNSGGIEYSQATFAVKRQLQPGEIDAVRAYKSSLNLDAVKSDASDFSE